MHQLRDEGLVGVHVGASAVILLIAERGHHHHVLDGDGIALLRLDAEPHETVMIR